MDNKLNKTWQSMQLLLQDILTTDSEESFFENSAEIMRVCAATIEQSLFAQKHKEIPYALQAIEYSIDQLNDLLLKKKISTLDN